MKTPRVNFQYRASCSLWADQELPFTICFSMIFRWMSLSCQQSAMEELQTSSSTIFLPYSIPHGQHLFYSSSSSPFYWIFRQQLQVLPILRIPLQSQSLIYLKLWFLAAIIFLVEDSEYIFTISFHYLRNCTTIFLSSLKNPNYFESLISKQTIFNVLIIKVFVTQFKTQNKYKSIITDKKIQFNSKFKIYIQVLKYSITQVKQCNTQMLQYLPLQMKVIILALALALVLIPTNSLFLPVTSRPICITIQEQADKQVHFFYEVTGNDPQNMKVDFQPQAGSLNPFSLTGQSGKTKYTSPNMKVCFISTDGGYKSVSVDFYSQDVAHLAQLAKKSDLYELHTKLINVGEKIKQVNRNQIFEQERQAIHGRIIEQHESKLKILVIAKLVAIVIVAVAQIYLLKTMLSKSSQGYQPV